MHFTSATLIVAALAVQQAVATGGYGGGWGSEEKYSTPDNTNNDCKADQSNGYDWSGLDTGSFEKYGSNKFSGWKCEDRFGKRDLLYKRTFQTKCIASNLDDEPSISCDGEDKMSISKYEVSSDEDAEIECNYEMPDGSSCKEYHSCSSSGSVIENTQCGGATKVTFKAHGDSKGKGCNIGVHSVDFNCGSASSTPPSYPTTSASVSSYTQPPIDSASSSVTSPVYQPTTAPGYSSSESSSIYPPSSSNTPPVYPTSSPTLPGYGNSTGTPPAGSSYSSTDVSPVTNTYSNTPPETTQVYPPPACPNVLPKCINSWLYLVECAGQSDYECFCKSDKFMEKVYSCISAWSDADDDTNSGVGYLMGICAKYVPENPAIITACPSTVTPATGYTPSTTKPAKTLTQYSTIVATVTSCGAGVSECPAAIQTSTYAVTTAIETPPAYSSTEGSPVTSPEITSPAAVPCTTITYSSSYVVPATGSVSSYTTSIVTTVTVPQVVITTYTITESGTTQTVPGLGYNPPATSSSPAGYESPSAPAPAPYPTTSAPGPVGPGYTSGLGTTYIPPAASTSLAVYEGAGAKLTGSEFAGVVFAAAAALFVL